MSSASEIETRRRALGRRADLRRLALRLAAVLVATVLVIPDGAAARGDDGAVGLPGAPTNLVITARDGAIDLSWDPPTDDGGSAISGYVVGVAAPWAAWTEHEVGDVGEHSLSGLTNGKTYRVRVRAVTAAGAGPFTPTTFLTAGQMPDVPAVVTLSNTGYRVTEVRAEWPAEVDPDVIGVDYLEVEQSIDGVTWDVVTSIVPWGGKESIRSVVTDGVTHYVRVRAVNADLVGPWSEPVAFIHGWPPLAPASVSIKWGRDRATLLWAPPASEGGSPITRYTVQLRVGSGYRTVATAPGSARSQVVTGLKSGTRYELRVVAVNAYGVSKPSGWHSVTPRSAPAAPVVTVHPRSGTAIVSWSEPASNGGGITSYVVQRYVGNGNWTSRVLRRDDPDYWGRHYWVTRLQNGTTYAFRVVARNELGYTYSSVVRVTPRGAPSAPAVSSRVGPGRVRVSWTAPNDGGSAITSYAIQRFVGGTWRTVVNLPASARTHVFTGLPNGTRYTYRVVARNAVGTGAFSKSTGAITPGQPV